MNVTHYLFGWSGRIGRLQWWLGGLVQAVIVGVAVALFILAAHEESPFLLVFALPLIGIALWFGVCLSIKRLHDHNKSGFWFFVYFIPVVGMIWQLIECGLMRGTEGDNDYGPDPRFRFDVSDDVEALIAARDREIPSRQKIATPAAPIASPSSRVTAVADRPVFGKRVYP
jgi:uncharacterized membrane protein YhaH (DUF805 family)